VILGSSDADVAPLTGDDAVADLLLPGALRPGTLMVIRAGGEVVGVGGEIAADLLDGPAWAAPAFALEIRLTEAMARPPRPELRPVPTQPASDRDLALLVPDAVPAAAVSASIRDAAGPLLERLEVFDLYTGAGVPPGTRSIAYRLVFRHAERTLRDEEVDEAVDRVLNRLSHDHGIARRG
jgi:phenylalanyl-tRNA synthetase beta chain